MHLKYLHYFGNESSDSILEAYGIITKDKVHSDALRSKQCTNCNEPNKPDSKFCAKCRMVLTYDAYNETLENQQEKDAEIQRLIEKQEQDMRLSDLESKQLTDLRNRYNQFYESEEDRDQDPVGQIIQHIESQHFSNHINDIFDVFNIK